MKRGKNIFTERTEERRRGQKKGNARHGENREKKKMEEGNGSRK